MSDDKEKDLAEALSQQQELMAQVLGQLSKPQPDVVTSSSKYIGWIQGMAGLVVLVIGLGINWGITKTKLEVLETTVEAQKTLMLDRLEKAEQDVHELQLKQAGDDQLLKNIQSSVEEIKADVKKLAGSP